MQDDTQKLPDNPTELRALLLETRAQLQRTQATLKHRDLEIEQLKLQLAKLRRMQFGRSSERLTQQIQQLELRLQELEAPEAEKQTITPLARNPLLRKPVRRPLPSHLPREVVTHSPVGSCPNCGGNLKSLGEDVSEVLEYVPARFKVIRHVRPKLTCGCCQTIVQAPAASRPLERGMAGPKLLAHVLVSKYADHLPLYRQAAIFRREGIELERSTLADWVAQVSALLAPMGRALGVHVLAGATLHADDTPVPVLAPGMGKTRTGRLWSYVRDERPAGQDTPPAVWLQYSADRKGEHPQRHLKTYRGILHADGYTGFNQLYASGSITEAACWAHVRRKFYDIVQANASPVAAEAIERIAALYAIEKEIRAKPPDYRRAIREARAGPLLAELKIWLQKQLSMVSAKSSLAQAIGYALSRWTALTRYLCVGRIEIDNNAAERSLRAVALGRKNYLFAGSDAGGERAALIYSLIGTARLNQINPQDYLAYVIERIADHPINRVDELLPWHVAAALAPCSRSEATTPEAA
ncbi:MAG: IS66 family transposase [Gammaproteobacteria bacterium]|nr:IS66 family transposase [Gammaproteobacteria bacterium]